MENKGGNILMHKYEVGKLLGQGTFAKVHHARDLKTGQSVAIKIVDKEKVLKVGLIQQIKREISAMRLIRHPNVVQLYEVMASRSKIYFVMEYLRGGELFNKVSKGRLKEEDARRYFQQLIAAVDFCHSRGVYHRDLKPENLLLDEFGNLKVTDFGLSALVDSKRRDDLLHTTCGTPAYVAPEVVNKRGYDGEKSDIWSCGVILYVLLAGFLPFNDPNLIQLYAKIRKADFKCPHWFPPEVRKLLSRILDPNPTTRITVSGIKENTWFRNGLRKTQSPTIKDQGNDDVTPRSVLDITKFDYESPKKKDVEEEEEREEDEESPASFSTKGNRMNAFDLISKSPGLDLSGLFEKDSNSPKRPETWFTTRMPPSQIVWKLEEAAKSTAERFKITKKDGIVSMEGSKMGRKGKLAIDVEIFEVAPWFHVVELKKTAGDTMEYLRFREEDLKPCLKDVVWRWQGAGTGESPTGFGSSACPS